jgi:hypothetical protein
MSDARRTYRNTGITPSAPIAPTIPVHPIDMEVDNKEKRKAIDDHISDDDSDDDEDSQARKNSKLDMPVNLLKMLELGREQL